MSIQKQFLDDVATWFGSGIYEVDYIDPDHREEARQRINSWVEDVTDGLIQELIPAEALSETSRMVLVNSLHLKASWTDRKSTRLNSSHVAISYAVFCLKKKSNI